MGILRDLKNGLEDELDYVLPNYIDNAEIILDEPQRLNFIMAYESHILGRGFKSIHERKKLYSSVSKEALVEAMNNIFTVDNLVLNIKTKKKKSLNKREVRSIIQKYL